MDINYEQTLGQRETISFYDAALINRAYCSGKHLLCLSAATYPGNEYLKDEEFGKLTYIWSLIHFKHSSSDKCERVNIVVPTCQNGGYVDARSCKSCLCPTGFTGASCQSVLTGPSCPTPHLQATAQWKELTWSGQDKCAWSIQVTVLLTSTVVQLSW